MAIRLSPSAQRVQDALAAHGLQLRVVELQASTRTAVEAAAAVGCSVGQIVKSLVFRGTESGRPLLVVASGTNCVSEASLTQLLGEPVERPDADYVRRVTGFAIGGVAPVGHRATLPVWIDEDLLRYAEIWAAADTPRVVFRLTPAELQILTGGRVGSLKA